MPLPSKTVCSQDPPNAIQLELVEGCSIACSCCAVQGIRASVGGYKFMTADTMAVFCKHLKLAMQNGWNPRIELAVHGEPTMHPQLVQMCAALGALEPRELILVSNGTKLAHNPNDLVPKLIEAGVTSICMDEYEGCDFVKQFKAKYTGDVPVFDFKNEKFRSNPRKPPFIVIKDDVVNLTTPYDKVNTHCGAGCAPGEVNPALHKRCAKPFRELTVRWDGNVALCCNDFRGIYKIGNITDFVSLDQLWQHKRFVAAREMLLDGNRDFIPCKWCDAISPRVGLLPDKYGKRTMSKPGKHTAEAIAEAIAGAPYTKPVLRGWETATDNCLPPLYPLTGLQHQPIDE